MLTPVFSITQSANELVIVIQAKYANVAETEIEYGEREFLFSSTPYFLRLHLPADVIDDESGTAKYDSDAGIFTVTVPKLKKGEHFDGLDMITQLLRPQVAEASARPLVEVIPNEEEGNELDSDDEDIEGNEFLVDQNPSTGDIEVVADVACKEFGYGFAWRRMGVCGRMQDEIGKLLELEDPECSRIEERVAECFRRDHAAFKAEHYIADTLDPPEELEEILKWKLPQEEIRIGDADRERMKDLPRRVLPKLLPAEARSVSLSLVDIIFARSYDLRVNMGDECVESSWTISRLAPSLCAFARWKSTEEALTSAARRALCYPLYRNWNTVEAVLQDTLQVFNAGREAVVHALCCIHGQMAVGGEFRYLLNDLLLTDLLLWTQAASEDIFSSLAAELRHIQLTRASVELNLDDLEMEARLAMMRVDNEETDSDDD